MSYYPVSRNYIDPFPLDDQHVITKVIIWLSPLSAPLEVVQTVRVERLETS